MIELCISWAEKEKPKEYNLYNGLASKKLKCRSSITYITDGTLHEKQKFNPKG